MILVYNYRRKLDHWGYEVEPRSWTTRQLLSFWEALNLIHPDAPVLWDRDCGHDRLVPGVDDRFEFLVGLWNPQEDGERSLGVLIDKRQRWKFRERLVWERELVFISPGKHADVVT